MVSIDEVLLWGRLAHRLRRGDWYRIHYSQPLSRCDDGYLALKYASFRRDCTLPTMLRALAVLDQVASAGSRATRLFATPGTSVSASGPCAATAGEPHLTHQHGTATSSSGFTASIRGDATFRADCPASCTAAIS